MNGEPLSRAELLERPLLKRNLAALAAGDQHRAAAWLTEAPGLKAVAEVNGESGEPIVVAGGQTQASRRDPAREAGLWLDKLAGQNRLDGDGELILFGLGAPWPAARLLERFPGRSLWIFEPDPLVALAVLSHHDFSAHLAGPEPELRFLTPWQVAEEKVPAGAVLLIHPPAQRREPARLSRLRRALDHSHPDLAPLSGRKPRLMLIPPLSGGSWPVALSLGRAAEAGGYPFLFLEWGPELNHLEEAAQKAPPAEAGRLAARLFELAAPQAAEAAADWRPDLVVALAQAPLDAPALERLRAAAGAPLAFWLVEDYRFFNYVAEVAPAYDALFHIQEGLIEPVLKNWGLSRAWYLPLAADAGLFRPRAEAETAGYRADLSFMGAGYPNRRRLLTRLAERYWPRTGRPAEAFRVFGSGWSGADPALKGHLFEGGRRVSLPECALIYAGGRVNLNIHSSTRPNPEFEPESRFVNPRTFEIAAAGALQIVDPRPLLPPMFQEGRELVTAERPEDLPDLIDHYLAHPEEAEAIGRAARARVLAEHTYVHRLERLLASLGWTES